MSNDQHTDHGNGWMQKFPTEEGPYWFYGQRAGNIQKMEMLFCIAFKAGDKSMVLEANGKFIYKNELGEKWAFKRTGFPEAPNFDNNVG